MYDERSTYRGDYNGGKEPYAEDLPWKAESCKPTETGARGISKLELQSDAVE